MSAKRIEMARAIRRLAELQALDVDEADAMSVKALFPEWSPDGVEYFDGNDGTHKQSRVLHEDTLYKCIGSHTSQADWVPGKAVSLWVRMDDPAIEWPEWVKPTGSHDAYDMGAKVSHKGKHWINTGKDKNEYEPGVWGWDEQ